MGGSRAAKPNMGVTRAAKPNMGGSRAAKPNMGGSRAAKPNMGVTRAAKPDQLKENMHAANDSESQQQLDRHRNRFVAEQIKLEAQDNSRVKVDPRNQHKSQKALDICIDSLDEADATAMLTTYSEAYLLTQCVVRIGEICERPTVTVEEYLDYFHDALKAQDLYDDHMAEYAYAYEPLKDMAYYEDKFGTLEDVMNVYYPN